MADNFYTCDADDFLVSMEHILNTIPQQLEPMLEGAVDRASRYANRRVKTNARHAGFHTDTDTGSRYVRGWGRKIQKNGNETSAEVGNRETPGLAHLLEKGHAKVGGGRVQAFPHIKTAADEAALKLWKEVKEAVDNL